VEARFWIHFGPQGIKPGPLPGTAGAFVLFASWEEARGHFLFITKDQQGNGGTWFDRRSALHLLSAKKVQKGHPQGATP